MRLCIIAGVSFITFTNNARSQGADSIVISVTSQNKEQKNSVFFLNGYRVSRSGQTITYHSSHPDAETALLCRVRRDASLIEWETDTLPDIRNQQFYRFVWLAGIERIGWGNAAQPHTFYFSINGVRWFTFTNRKDSSASLWTMSGKDGAELTFQSHMVDKFGDLFGYMYLKLPRKDFQSGMPLILRVEGVDADSPEWYMAFQYRFNFSPHLRVEPALIREKEVTKSLLRLSLDNLDGSRIVDISFNTTSVVHQELKAGANIFSLPVPAVTTDQTISVIFKVGNIVMSSMPVTIKPVQRREIYLIPHTHNDIGYTDFQPAVEKKQWQNLDEALQLIRNTKEYPPEARFKWNMEILWPLESYWENASSEKRAEIINAVKEGSLGINALFVNPLTGLANATEMSHFTDYARMFAKTLGSPTRTAAVSDIPGFTWGIVTALAQSGIKYFASAPNAGDRIGYVLQSWGDKPFYWASQSGKEKVLFWIAGASYSSFHEGTLSHLGAEKIMKLLRKIEEEEYPYDLYYLPYTLGDNGSPDPNLSEFVRRWNETYVSPTLIISTHEQMFKEFERRYGLSLSTRKGDFTPYWEDGAASTAYETALNRRVVDRLIQSEALWSMQSPQQYPEQEYYEAWRNVVLWDEHTWGADKSVTDPDDPGVIGQWNIKQHYVLDSDSASRLLLHRAVSSHLQEKRINTFDIYNTNSWMRSDIVFLTKEQSLEGDFVVDETGSRLPSQRLSTGELAVIVKDVPPLSSKRIFVKKESASAKGNVRISSQQLENEYLSLTLDGKTGTITTLTSKKDLTQFVNPSMGLNTYLYVRGKDPDSALTLSNVRVNVKERGSILASYIVEGDAPGCKTFSSEIRVSSGINRADIITTIDKTAIREKEGMHFAFPFLVPDGELRYDVADAIVKLEQDQLEGSCKNFFSIQSFVDISNAQHGVTWASIDAPMVEIGDITAESPWMKSVQPSQKIYSYVMNNYWHTNYKADQSGMVTFSYSIMPHREFRSSEAVRFGIERRQPLLVETVNSEALQVQSLCTLNTNDVIIQSIKPVHRGTAYLLRLYNPTSTTQRVELRWNKKKPVSMYNSSCFANVGKEIKNEFPMDGYVSQYILVRKK